MIIAQLSDTHIREPGQLAYQRVDTAAFLSVAIRTLMAQNPLPDVVVMTGDLVDFATPAEYQHLAELIRPLTMPVYLVPGNHDERDALRAAFPDHRYLPPQGFLQYAIDAGPVRLVALDTLVPGKGSGELCADRLAWLDRTLAAAPQHPTVVMMHHPPFKTGIAYMDGDGLAQREAFAEVIARHPQVERIIAGHLHRPIQCRVGGTVASTCPSPAHQIHLDLLPSPDVMFRMEPPAFQLHVWLAGQGLVTHTVVIGDYDGPHPFREAGRLIR